MEAVHSQCCTSQLLFCIVLLLKLSGNVSSIAVDKYQKLDGFGTIFINTEYKVCMNISHVSN